MTGSIFEILEKEELTSLTIRYDWRTGVHQLFAARLWDKATRFANYNQSFTTTTPLLSEVICLNTEATTALFAKHDSSDYLQAVLELLRKGKHAGIDCLYHRASNIRFMNHVHSDVLGINNRRHAIRAGGIRRHDLDEDEYAVVIDGLNLSRGMSFKNFAARIPYGGSKMTVTMAPLDLGDMEALGFIAYALDLSRTFTGPDMGFPPELADVLKRHFTINITGGPNGPLGATGTPTAYGTYLAVKEAVHFVKGSASLDKLKIAVQGLGAVGFPLCEHYIKEGAALTVADIDAGQVAKLRSKFPAASIEGVPPDEILFVDAEVFSPCARGGIITAEVIPKLRFRIILGAANNQLRASSRAEECTLAAELDRQGILFQVGWWHNLGGVLCGREEYEKQQDASIERVTSTTGRICAEFTRKNLTESKQLRITPTELAYRTAEAAIYGES